MFYQYELNWAYEEKTKLWLSNGWLAAVDCFDDSLVAAATLTCCRYSVAESGSAA